MGQRNNIPRRKRYVQKVRLTKAPEFIKNYTGKNLIKGYAKHFGVDKLCAIKELELSGVIILEEYKKQVINSHTRLVEERRKKKEKKKESKTENFSVFDSDENFAFIMGYTSGGAAYGITWEEQKKNQEKDEDDFDFDFDFEMDEDNMDWQDFEIDDQDDALPW